MKNKFIILIISSLVIVVIMSFKLLNNSKFYYAYNEKILLNESDNKLVIRYKHTKNSDKKLISLTNEFKKEIKVSKL